MMNLLTKKEVCQKLGINERTFERYVQEENLPVIPITTHRKFVDKDELLEWLRKKKQLREKKLKRK
jgi:excisionase family DNA binding protein